MIIKIDSTNYLNIVSSPQMLRIFMQRAFSAQEINYNSSAKIHHFADMAKKNSIKNYM